MLSNWQTLSLISTRTNTGSSCSVLCRASTSRNVSQIKEVHGRDNLGHAAAGRSRMTLGIMACKIQSRLWVKSVALFNRRLPVNFRYAPVSDRDRAAVQYVAKGHVRTSDNSERAPVRTDQPCLARAIVYSPLSVLREYVVVVLHHRVASEPALRVVFLRRFGGCGRGLKRIGRRVIVERAPSPSPAIREPLAVLHPEINVMLRTWHGWLTGVRLLLFRCPMNFRHFRAVRERLAIAGHAFLIGVDHCRIPHDHSNKAFVLTDRDHRPVLVSPELREGEPIRYLQSVLVLRGNRGTNCQDGDRRRNAEADQRAFFHCRISLIGLGACDDQ